MKSIHLILANQLFDSVQNLDAQNHSLLMIESFSLCSRYKYHKYKISYLLTCMREYRDRLRQAGFEVIYYELDQGQEFGPALELQSKNFDCLEFFEIPDKEFGDHVRDIADKYFSEVRVLPSPQFLVRQDEMASYLLRSNKKRVLMNDFYIYQRKNLNLLVDKVGAPVGGQWSFDSMNRKKLPSSQQIPKREYSYPSQHWQPVKEMVEQKFAGHPGLLPQTSWLPLNSSQAQSHLDNFLTNYFELFGDYEDALTSRDEFVFHSVISPLLNNGLLTPSQVLSRLSEFVLQRYGLQIFATSNEPPKTLPLNSLEGFIRQIIGWREWMKGMYDHKYSRNLRSYNFFDNHQPLPGYFWDRTLLEADQTIASNIPLKLALQKAHDYGWCHHIERLMILGNWMLLNQYDPHECYDWFMSMFVDAYEWVMVPNVYGMGLFADGGIFATKPYISGGNYIKKMSDYQNAGQWEKIWTDKFWDFIGKHEEYFTKQPRLGMLLQSRKKSHAQSELEA